MKMKHVQLIAFICILHTTVFAQVPKQIETYKEYPIYTGKDLGVTYSPAKTVFKVWAPNATQVILKLYSAGDGGKVLGTFSLSKSINGVWETVIKKNIKNNYYAFQVKHAGNWLLEKPDIYAKAVGINGKRGMVVDLAATNPTNWQNDKKPVQKNFTDIVLYETHVRDLSISNNAGIKHKGQFLGMAEKGTKSNTGATTGLDHIKELGVTHIHLLPYFDFNSIDETKPNANYNWGYDPVNYNVPEGSYATNATDGNVRIKEFKQMIQTLHANGLRVILDVVYNHTADRNSGFNQFAPDYFYRQNANGSYSDASGCGNETASETPMMRSFMVASVAYWAKEYHLDGFRFDLMGAHDIETMNQISDTLRKIDPTIFIYGEGWTAGASPLAEEQRATKKNTYQLKNIAAFSDEIRDGLRGPYDKVTVKGYISGEKGTKQSVMFGIVAGVQHPQINYQQVNYSKKPWVLQPSQTISYISCHDDNTLFDRLKIGNPTASEAALIKMDKLGHTVVLTSQGVTFLHAGAEMLRTKKGIANSYNSPDSINEIDWSRKTTYADVYNYYKALIALRKHHPAFRMPTTTMIQDHLQFIDMTDPLVIGYQIKGNANGDAWKDILVLLNGDGTDKAITLPKGNWKLASDGNTVNEKGIKQITDATITLPATTAFILFQ
jgi:pullulanase